MIDPKGGRATLHPYRVVYRVRPPPGSEPENRPCAVGRLDLQRSVRAIERTFEPHPTGATNGVREVLRGRRLTDTSIDPAVPPRLRGDAEQGQVVDLGWAPISADNTSTDTSQPWCITPNSSRISFQFSTGTSTDRTRDSGSGLGPDSHRGHSAQRSVLSSGRASPSRTHAHGASHACSHAGADRNSVGTAHRQLAALRGSSMRTLRPLRLTTTRSTVAGQTCRRCRTSGTAFRRCDGQPRDRPEETGK